MAMTRVVVMMAAAGLLATGISTTVAWAGGPDGIVEGSDIPFRAVGTGTFENFQDGPGRDSTEVGFAATGATATKQVLLTLADFST